VGPARFLSILSMLGSCPGREAIRAENSSFAKTFIAGFVGGATPGRGALGSRAVQPERRNEAKVLFS